MTGVPGPIAIIVIVLMLAGVSGIKIARDDERFIVYRLGRYLGLRGPGLVYRVSGIDQFTRVRVGHFGHLIDAATARFEGVAVPVVTDGARVGDTVRVTGFDNERVVVVGDPSGGREIRCEKCGHINRI